MKTFAHEVYFKELEQGNHFYARLITDGEWGQQFGATHVIMFESGCEERYVEIGTTVAYVHIDENADGTPVKEKWNIRHR